MRYSQPFSATASTENAEVNGLAGAERPFNTALNSLSRSRSDVIVVVVDVCPSGPLIAAVVVAALQHNAPKTRMYVCIYIPCVFRKMQSSSAQQQHHIVIIFAPFRFGGGVDLRRRRRCRSCSCRLSGAYHYDLMACGTHAHMEQLNGVD